METKDKMVTAEETQDIGVRPHGLSMTARAAVDPPIWPQGAAQCLSWSQRSARRRVC